MSRTFPSLQWGQLSAPCPPLPSHNLSPFTSDLCLYSLSVDGGDPRAAFAVCSHVSMNTPHHHSPSHWWSRSKPSTKLTKEKPLEGTPLPRTYTPSQAGGLITDQPTKQSSMFGNFTSAIRFKPKKNTHTIAIQEPPKAPSPLIIPPPNSVEPYGPLTSRPYSKAVSTATVTDEDSIEPKTPLDLRLSYQRSLVDSDPFAATTGVMFSPKEAQEFEQLFVVPGPQLAKHTPVRPRTPSRRPLTPQLIRERLMSESAPPSPRRPANRSAVTVKWVISRRHINSRSSILTSGSQTITRCAKHEA